VLNNSLTDIGLAVVASQTCQLAQNSEKIWTYSSSRSSRVDGFGTNPGVTGRPKEAWPPQLSSCASPDIFIRSRKWCVAKAGFRY